jgi:hypothetical protein
VQRSPLHVDSQRWSSVDWKIEVIVVPVSGVDRSKKFYGEQLAFVVDVDQQVNEKADQS